MIEINDPRMIRPGQFFSNRDTNAYVYVSNVVNLYAPLGDLDHPIMVIFVDDANFEWAETGSWFVEKYAFGGLTRNDELEPGVLDSVDDNELMQR